MCRVILTALLAVGLFAVCLLTALWMQPGALSKLTAGGAHSKAAAAEDEPIALHPNAIARVRAQMARRVAPWQPQAAQFVQERVAMVCALYHYLQMPVSVIHTTRKWAATVDTVRVSNCRSLGN